MTDGVVHHDEQRGIHRLLLDHGPNALDLSMMSALGAEIERLAAAGAPAFVLASAHPTMFCPGWDLKILGAAGHDQVAAFLDAFNELVLALFSYPGPTAAEIGGHAVAGGCLLAACCDLRVMAGGRPRLGLSELNLGVPVPWSSLRMLRARLGSSALDELVFRGEGCTAERARELGIVHRVVQATELTATTMLELGRLASRPKRAFVESKRFLFGGVWQEMAGGDAAADAAFLECWFDPETQQRIAGAAGRLGS
jgi:enoyl-CoA hydratase